VLGSTDSHCRCSRDVEEDKVPSRGSCCCYNSLRPETSGSVFPSATNTRTSAASSHPQAGAAWVFPGAVSQSLVVLQMCQRPGSARLPAQRGRRELFLSCRCLLRTRTGSVRSSLETTLAAAALGGWSPAFWGLGPFLRAHERGSSGKRSGQADGFGPRAAAAAPVLTPRSQTQRRAWRERVTCAATRCCSENRR